MKKNQYGSAGYGGADCNPNRRRQEGRKFKVSLSYTVGFKPAWATCWDPIWNNNNNKKCVCGGGGKLELYIIETPKL